MPPKTAKKPHSHDPSHSLSTALVPAGHNAIASNVTANNATTNNGNSSTALAIVDDVSSPVEGLRNFVERQSEVIAQQRDDIDSLRRRLEENIRVTHDFRAELSEIRRNWQQQQQTGSGSGNGSDVGQRLDELAAAFNDVQDRLYEIDKSWMNNLIVYGIPCSELTDEDPVITEEKVRDLLQRKLRMSREVSISRLQRVWHGPEFRGHRPVQICLVHYRDKEEILRRARLLRGSNIYIAEDFSRRVREHRTELMRFMREIKAKSGDAGLPRRMALRHDRLYVGHDVFFFNERTGRVERLQPHGLAGGDHMAAAAAAVAASAIADSQLHDSSWLRRPRSSSRCATPISRQNSMSADDLAASEWRSVASARLRRSPQKRAPTKSASIDSLDYDYGSAQNSPARVRKANTFNNGFGYKRHNTNGIGGSHNGVNGPSRYNPGSAGSNGHDYDGERDGSGTPSPTKARLGKSVAFKEPPEDKLRETALVPLGHFVVDDDDDDEEYAFAMEPYDPAVAAEAARVANNGRMITASAPLPPIAYVPKAMVPIHNTSNIASIEAPAISRLPAILHTSLDRLNAEVLRRDSDPDLTMLPLERPHHLPLKAIANGNGHAVQPAANAGLVRVAMFGEFCVKNLEEEQLQQQQQRQQP